MSDNRDTRRRLAEQIDKLIPGCSMQAGIANKYWLALIVVSVTIFTTYGNEGAEKIKLPVGLGGDGVDPVWFYMICIVGISAITIAYVTAHLEVTMLKNRIKELRNNLRQMEEDGDIPHAERESAITGEMIASCIVPNMNKVSSIPEYLFRRHGIKRSIPYVILKVVSWLFTYGIPLWALYLCANGLRINVMLRTEWPAGWRIVLVGALLSVALIAFACMFVQLLSDVEWTRKMIVDSKKHQI